MGSVRFAEAFQFGFPWEASACIANVSLVAAPSKTQHLNSLRPETLFPGGLRLEILAMALLVDYDGRPSKSIGNYECIFSSAGLRNAECPVSAAFTNAMSARSEPSRKSKFFITGRV